MQRKREILDQAKPLTEELINKVYDEWTGHSSRTDFIKNHDKFTSFGDYLIAKLENNK